MTIQDLGSVGELLAAIATIATLAYLAVQLKQNTASARASSAAAHSEAMRSLNLVIAQDAELAKLYWSGLTNRAALEDDDQRRFDFVMGALTQGVEQAWKFRHEGVIDDAAWDAQSVAISWLAHQPGFVDYFKIYGPMHHSGFVEIVERAKAEELQGDATAARQQGVAADPMRGAGQA